MTTEKHDMLSFSRNKIVGVEHIRQDILHAHGVLDDNIYGMELDVDVKLPDLEITSIKGDYRRYTTPECPKAIPQLQSAIGLCIVDPEFARKVNRLVGKAGCTHFANLLIECCDSILQTALYGDWQETTVNLSGIGKEEYLQSKLITIPKAKKRCLVI